VDQLIIDTLKRYNAVRVQNYNPILRLICVGNDMDLNKFVNHYMKAIEHSKANEHSKVYSNILKTEIRVYLIPMVFNSLAQYIATYDDVYNQEVFAPFIKDPLIPKLAPEAAGKEMTIDETEKLGAYFANTEIQIARDRQVQLYLREATRFMNVKVCKAELYKGEMHKENITVYFVCRAEIGLHSVYSKSSKSITRICLPEMSSKFHTNAVPIKIKYFNFLISC